MKGCISREEFDSCCEKIIERSHKLADNFQVFHNQRNKGEKYLTKKSSKVIKDAPSCLQDNLVEWDVIDTVEEGSPDNQVVLCDGSGHVINFEHHVVYSDSYNVPVMYFIAYTQDGGMVTLDELWSIVPDCHKNALEDKWSFITQQEHPYLLRPFYQLHPCHTSTFMAHLVTESVDNYVLMWLSAVGPVVNLHLPMEYYDTRCENNKDV